jgi:hypothetical protein
MALLLLNTTPHTYTIQGQEYGALGHIAICHLVISHPPGSHYSLIFGVTHAGESLGRCQLRDRQAASRGRSPAKTINTALSEHSPCDTPSTRIGPALSICSYAGFYADALRQGVLHCFCSALLHGGEHMAVGVEGDSYGRMAEYLRDDLGIYVLG